MGPQCGQHSCQVCAGVYWCFCSCWLTFLPLFLQSTGLEFHPLPSPSEFVHCYMFYITTQPSLTVLVVVLVVAVQQSTRTILCPVLWSENQNWPSLTVVVVVVVVVVMVVFVVLCNYVQCLPFNLFLLACFSQSYQNPATPGGASYDNPATPSPVVPESPQSTGGSHYGMYGTSYYTTPSPGLSPLTPGSDYSPRTPGSPMDQGEGGIC